MGQKTTAKLKRIAVIVAKDRLTASVKMVDLVAPVLPAEEEVVEDLTDGQVSVDDSVPPGEDPVLPTDEEVIEDLTEARVSVDDSVPPVEDPVLPTEEEVVDALMEAQVSVDDSVRSRIEEFISLVNRGESPSEDFVVAEGQPAQEGTDEEFVWDELFEKSTQDRQEDDPVNYYSANSVITVEEGVTVGTITPLVEPKTGVDVYGAPIKPAGTPRRIEVDDSVERTEEDPPRLIAKVPGLVRFKSNKVFIDEVLFVDGDVDFATSNIDSCIDVVIKGTIHDRFEVKSSKNITVGGAIEAAIVHADEDVVVRGGILGRDIAMVSAGRNIIAKFCAESNLRAEGDIKISRELMNCRTHIEGKLLADHGAVIGGHLYVKEGAAIGTIGSEANVPTRIAVGIHPLAIKESEKFREDVNAKREAMGQLLHAVRPFLRELKRLTSEQKEEVKEMLSKARELQAAIVEAEKHCERILDAARAENPPRVLVAKTIYPGVSISIGKRAAIFQTELKGPVAIEKHKVDNVTEFVVVSQVNGSVEVIASMKLPLDELLEGFEDEPEPEPDPEASDDGAHGDQLSEVSGGSDVE